MAAPLIVYWRWFLLGLLGLQNYTLLSLVHVTSSLIYISILLSANAAAEILSLLIPCWLHTINAHLALLLVAVFAFLDVLLLACSILFGTCIPLNILYTVDGGCIALTTLVVQLSLLINEHACKTPPPHIYVTGRLTSGILWSSINLLPRLPPVLSTLVIHMIMISSTLLTNTTHILGLVCATMDASIALKKPFSSGRDLAHLIALFLPDLAQIFLSFAATFLAFPALIAHLVYFKQTPPLSDTLSSLVVFTSFSTVACLVSFIPLYQWLSLRAKLNTNFVRLTLCILNLLRLIGSVGAILIYARLGIEPYQLALILSCIHATLNTLTYSYTFGCVLAANKNNQYNSISLIALLECAVVSGIVLGAWCGSLALSYLA